MLMYFECSKFSIIYMYSYPHLALGSSLTFLRHLIGFGYLLIHIFLALCINGWFIVL